LRNRYDVVHCHLLASNWLGKPLARVLGTPVVISHDHCIDPWRANSRVVRSIDRLANRFADEIFAVSASTRDHLIDNEHISPAKIRVMPNCVPESPRRQHTGTAGKLIGGAGRLVPQKNFARFLQIARALTDIDASYRFMIAGEGPLEATLRKEAATLGVNVEWLGVQPSLDRFFSEIDLFLLTSDFEGSPMTLLEALAYGVPAAAMAVDGIQEEFTDEILLLNPGNTNLELSRFIHERLENRSELADQADRGREIVARRFSARKQAGEMEQLYVKVLESKRG
jgi:glycosyltransferase involved in cell wall biosynthesis